MLGIIRDMVDVLVDTEEFFSQRRGKKDAMIHFTFISTIALVINWTLIWNGISPAGLIPFEDLVANGSIAAFIIPFIYFVSSFLLLGFFSLMLHNLLKCMDNGIKPTETVSVVAYSLTPAILTMWFPVLGLLCMVWFIYILIQGLGMRNKASKKDNGKASIATGLITTIPFVLMLLGTAYWLTSVGIGDPSLIWTVLIPF